MGAALLERARTGSMALDLGGLTQEELIFIARFHYRGAGGQDIAKMINRPVSAIEAVRERLDPLPKRAAPAAGSALPAARPSMENIARRVAWTCGVTLADLRGPSRKVPIVRARQAAFHACREVRTPDGAHLWSTPTIGRYFNRNHATILHGVARHAGRLAELEAEA